MPCWCCSSKRLYQRMSKVEADAEDWNELVHRLAARLQALERRRPSPSNPFTKEITCAIVEALDGTSRAVRELQTTVKGLQDTQDQLLPAGRAKKIPAL